MQIWFFLPFGALAPKVHRTVVSDPPDPPDPDRAREQARRHLSARLNPRLLKDVGLGED